MSRFRTYGPGDDTPEIDGDNAFVGIEQKSNAAAIRRGYAAEAVNKIFEEGSAETRRGLVTLRWANDAGVDFDITFGVALEATADATKTTYEGYRAFLYEATDSDDVDFEDGDRLIVSGFVDDAFNGDFTIASVTKTANGANWDYAIYVLVEDSVYDAAPASELAATATFEAGRLDWLDQGFGQVYGHALFSDPNELEGILVANQYGIWRIRPNTEPQLIPLPDYTPVAANVRLLQAFDRILLLRGTDLPTLVWNPEESFADGLEDFEAIVQSESRGTDADNTFGDGTATMPNAADGCVFGNRLFLMQGRDELLVSDILDYSRYNELTQRFRINSGTDDQMVRLMPWNENTLVVFKDGSVHMLGNCVGSLANVVQMMITDAFGLIGRDAVAPMGKDIWFLSHGQIRSLAQTIENKIQAEAQPPSAPIPQLMARINWTAAAGACCTQYGPWWLAAVPLDGSTFNNAILVYSVPNQSWSGYWTADFLDVLGFVTATWNGRKRLFVVQGNNATPARARGALLVADEDYMDSVSGVEYEISDELLTRGYGGDLPDQKRFDRFVVDHSTWRPKFSTAALVDGAYEEKAIVTDKTKDRTRFMRWNAVPFDVTNPDDDATAPYREDYSVAIGAAGISLGDNGVPISQEQRFLDMNRIGRRGRYVQARLTNTQGRRTIHGVMVEGAANKRSDGERA